MITNASIETSNGQLYMKKLCKHFSHKVPATFNESQGLIEFPFGACRIDVDNKEMKLSMKLEDQEKVELAEKVVSDHLLRMAHKEPLDIQWQREAIAIQP